MVDSVPIVLKTGTLTHNQMKIFLDTADTDIIEKYFSTGLVDGVTTNPTLIMKSGRNPEDVYQKIKDIGVQDIVWRSWDLTLRCMMKVFVCMKSSGMLQRLKFLVLVRV